MRQILYQSSIGLKVGLDLRYSQLKFHRNMRFVARAYIARTIITGVHIKVNHILFQDETLI